MSTASLRIDEWVEERSERERRDIRRRLIASAIGHALFVLLLFGLPSPSPLPLPAVVSVDLLAGLPQPARAPAPTARPAARPPAPKPPPRPAVVPPPRQKTKVLPREAPTARARPAPKPPPLDYDDALSSLRDELGEAEPVAEQVLDAEPTAARTSGSGRVDPELVAWQVAVNRALARSWVTPTEYRDSELRTLLLVTVMSNGSVLGEPRVERSSGDLHFDDNAVRAVLQASPLPPPPSSGDWPFLFNPTD
ncbi:MAG: TonB family protein [Myxococcota bacterium]|nr:TonB family protein [Myxococcota bacterium]